VVDDFTTLRYGESVKPILLVTLCLLASIAYSQSTSPIIRVHAFSQEIIPGVAPAMSEEGKLIQQPKRYFYQIYLECRPKARVKLLNVQANGKSFSANGVALTSPVVRLHPTTLQNDTLIRATKNAIMQVSLGSDFESTEAAILPQSKLLVRYVYKGKRRSVTIKKFTELPPIAMP
jgi:hypothetical protein